MGTYSKKMVPHIKLIAFNMNVYDKPDFRLSQFPDVDIVGMRNDCEAGGVVGGVWLGVGEGVVELQLLDQGGEEDKEGVPGQALPHAHPPPEAVRDKLLLLDQPPVPRLRPFQEPLRPVWGRQELFDVALVTHLKCWGWSQYSGSSMKPIRLPMAMDPSGTE